MGSETVDNKIIHWTVDRMKVIINYLKVNKEGTVNEGCDCTIFVSLGALTFEVQVCSGICRFLLY